MPVGAGDERDKRLWDMGDLGFFAAVIGICALVTALVPGGHGAKIGATLGGTLVLGVPYALWQGGRVRPRRSLGHLLLFNAVLPGVFFALFTAQLDAGHPVWAFQADDWRRALWRGAFFGAWMGLFAAWQRRGAGQANP